MDIVVHGKATISGEMRPPPSKFYTHFTTALASLSHGKSVVRDPLPVKDTLSLFRALEKLGVVISRGAREWVVWGTGGELRPKGNTLDVGNSATALSILTSISTLASRVLVVTGDSQLRSRPMPSLLRGLRRLGGEVYSTKPEESAPFIVFGGGLQGGMVDGVDARFLPAFLLPAPFASKGVEIRVRTGGEVLERCADFIQRMGVPLRMQGRRLIISEGSFRPSTLVVPPSLYQVAPFIVAACLTYSELRLRANKEKCEGVFLLKILEEMGMNFRFSREKIVIKGPQRAGGGVVDLGGNPDILPLIAVVASLAHGRTRLVNVSGAREMKSDRVSSMAKNLRKMGAKIKERRGELVIEGQRVLRGAEVDGSDDHAVAAALVVAGLVAEGRTVVRGGVGALRTSYSKFLSEFQKLGAGVSLKGD